MLKMVSAAIYVVALISGCATQRPSGVELRIDSSSASAAEASYEAMMDARDGVEQRELALAVLVIGSEDTKNAYDAINSPDPSIVTIRDKVAGMTAQEIIIRAAQVTSVRLGIPNN